MSLSLVYVINMVDGLDSLVLNQRLSRSYFVRHRQKTGGTNQVEIGKIVNSLNTVRTVSFRTSGHLI